MFPKWIVTKVRKASSNTYAWSWLVVKREFVGTNQPDHEPPERFGSFNCPAAIKEYPPNTDRNDHNELEYPGVSVFFLAV